MAEGFDPYHKWLGIPPKDQPPNHYRLLGIERFEADPQVIELAADRQMTHVRSFQTGPHSALSQRLLNELSAARICLLNAQRKAEYDRTLQSAVPHQATTVQPQPRPPAQLQPPAIPQANIVSAGVVPMGTMPQVAARSAQMPSVARPLVQPVPFGGLAPSLPPIRRPQKSNNTLVAVVAVGAILLVSIFVVSVLIVKMRSRMTVIDPNAEEARQAEPKPDNRIKKPVTPAVKKPEKTRGPTPPATAVVVPSVKFASARRYMALRDLDSAERELAAAQPACITNNDRQECNRLEQILPLLRAFWSAVQEGWNALRPGEELQIGNDLFTVVKVDPMSLVLRLAGREMAYNLASLTGDLAETLASNHLDANSPSIYLCLGAFHAMDRNGDPPRASGLWDQAANAGLNLAPLLPELNRPRQ